MAHELVLPRERSPTRALPFEIPTMLLMSPEVREDRELLQVTPLAHVHLGAMTPLVVVLDTYHGLERLELGMILVPFAPLMGA